MSPSSFPYRRGAAARQAILAIAAIALLGAAFFIAAGKLQWNTQVRHQAQTHAAATAWVDALAPVLEQDVRFGGVTLDVRTQTDPTPSVRIVIEGVIARANLAALEDEIARRSPPAPVEWSVRALGR